MNHPFDLLKSNLLDLLYELREADIRLRAYPKRPARLKVI
jgi:hypothetical protein